MHSSGRGEADVRRQLAQVQKQLQKYQAVYGDASLMSSDAARLSEQLQHKQAELEKLKLQDQQREQVGISCLCALCHYFSPHRSGRVRVVW